MHDEDAVREGEDLVQLDRDEQDRLLGGADCSLEGGRLPRRKAFVSPMLLYAPLLYAPSRETVHDSASPGAMGLPGIGLAIAS